MVFVIFPFIVVGLFGRLLDLRFSWIFINPFPYVPSLVFLTSDFSFKGILRINDHGYDISYIKCFHNIKCGYTRCLDMTLLQALGELP